MPVLNLAAYRFVPVADPTSWIVPLAQVAGALALKGTVIVADEGINLFVAGDAAAAEAFLRRLATDPVFASADGQPALEDLHVKRSWSATQPFRRLRVKHRPEIVTMRRPGVRPALRRAPGIAPARLARWLAQGHDDDGRPLTLLDTRNAFEVAQGTFEGARHLVLDRFDAFRTLSTRSWTSCATRPW